MCVYGSATNSCCCSGFHTGFESWGGYEGVSCKFIFCEGVSCKFLSITSFNPQLAWGGESCFGGGGESSFPTPLYETLPVLQKILSVVSYTHL